MGLRLPRTSGGPWGEVVAALDSGLSLAEAASAELDPRTAARLTAPGAGSWVDLLDEPEGARILVAEHSPGLAGLRMATAASVLGFADTDNARARFRQSWLADQPAELVFGSEERLAGDLGPWDVIVVDGLGPARGDERRLAARARRLAAGLAPHGRLVVVSDNQLSPLRAADRAAGRAAGPPGPSLRSVEHALTDTGMRVTQRFGLLRSSVDGVTTFDLDAPRAASAVLAAAIVNIEPVRALGLRLLRPLAQHGAAAPVVPAWLVVASPSSALYAPSASRLTGRLGHRGSEESKLLRGEPPTELEKRYSTPEAAAREAMALRELEARGLALAPRVVAQPGPDRLRQTWHPGRPMRPGGLRRQELRTWVARAARTIGAIQRATERSDGTVLVHGDFWLGNILVDADKVVAVLDWTRAHWGEPTEDVRHLVDHLVEMGLASGHEVSTLREIAVAAHRTP